MIHNKDLSIPTQHRGFQFRRGLATFLMLCSLCGLTCQSDDICRGVDGACLAIDVDAELEPLPLPGVTLEAVLTTSGNQEQVGDPDVSVVPLTALPLRWRITKLPGSVTPGQISKLEILARLPAGSGGGAGEIIASSIVEPLSWSDGSRQRIAVKLAPVAKPDPITGSPLPTSPGTSLDLAGQRLCYRHPDGTLATTITLGGKAATIETCETQKAKITLPALTWKKEGLQLLIKHASARPAAAGPLAIYPANFALHAPRSYPLPDKSRYDNSNVLAPKVRTEPSSAQEPVGYRNAIAMGDFDGDGKPDIAFPNYGLTRSTKLAEKYGSIHVIWGGEKSATASELINVKANLSPIHPYSIAASDINNDGVDDLFISSLVDIDGTAYEKEIANQVFGIYLIYGEKGDRSAIGNRWRRVSPGQNVNPYNLIIGHNLSDTTQGKQLLFIDGATINAKQSDELKSCYGLNYSQVTTNGADVSCTLTTDVPFDWMAPMDGSDGANGFISTVRPIPSSDPMFANKGIIDSLLLTNFGKKRIAILKNKRLRNLAIPSNNTFPRDVTSDFSVSLPTKQPVGAIFADVDFDGKDDLLIATKQYELILYRGFADRESSNFGLDMASPRTILVANSKNIESKIYDIVSADIDGDKKTDIILGTTDGVAIIRGSAGKFVGLPPSSTLQIAAPIDIGGDDYPELRQEVKVTDVNQDGAHDIVLLDKETSTLNIITGIAGSSELMRPNFLINQENYNDNQSFGISFFQDQSRSSVVVTNRHSDYVTSFQSVAGEECCKDARNTKPLPPTLVNCPPDPPVSRPKEPRDVIASDLDHDGQVDYLVSYDGNKTSGAAIYWGDQLDADASIVGEKCSLQNTYVKLSDLNSDGFDDLVLLRFGGEVSVLRNNGMPGSRGFSDTDPGKSIPLPAGETGVPWAVASIAWKEYGTTSSDNLIDLAIAMTSGNVYVYKNKGMDCTSCYSASSIASFKISDTPIAMDAQYMTRGQSSGVKDLVILTQRGIHLYQNGFPSSSALVEIAKLDYVLESQVISWAIGDLNADGINDIAVLNSNRSLVSVYLGSDKSGSRTWELHGHYAVGIRTTAISIADYDRDGLPDIVAANYRGANVSLVKNISN